MRGPFQRPIEHPFTVQERDRVTVLYGGLTCEHERLIAAAFRGNGYRCAPLPQPDRNAHELGKEFCSNNLCNPVYFTVGSLLAYLRSLEAEGMSRADIVRDYVYVTAASGGPCRFGMYEAEFRAALEAAGYHGFRVLLFVQDHGIKANTGHTGLQFTVDSGMDGMQAIVLGDILNSIRHHLRAYEIVRGSADRALDSISSDITGYFLSHRSFELGEHIPAWIAGRIARGSRAYRFPNTLGKVCTRLWGSSLTSVLRSSRRHFDELEVDWLRVRPVVKVIGEFWAQMTETDGNFRIFEFLEKEGAEVLVEPISTWFLYLLDQEEARSADRLRVQRSQSPPVAGVLRGLRHYWTRKTLFGLADYLYSAHYKRLSESLGIPQELVSQRTLAALADPHYNRSLRGGEGHLEVAKSLYYTIHSRAHMVLALKPFGCLPSMQSDAIQAALVDHYPNMTFLSVETAAEGEIHAYSRVQMALAEARAKAMDEFEKALQSTGRCVEELRDIVRVRPELRHPLYRIPSTPGVVSTAASFVFHLDRLLAGRRIRRVAAQAHSAPGDIAIPLTSPQQEVQAE